MITVRENIFIRFEDGVSVCRMELDVDSAAELPEADFMDDHLLAQGSIAHDISTGDFYCIDSEGTWYNQDGSGEYAPEDEEEDEEDSEPETLNTEQLSPLAIPGGGLHSDVISPAAEPTEVIISDNHGINDVTDNNVGDIIEQVDEPVELTEDHDSEGTGEVMEALSDNESISGELADSESDSKFPNIEDDE